MLIGVPAEIKNHEYRVGLTPNSVAELIANGHSVLVETSAGNGIGSSDHDYLSVGAEIVQSADQVFARADMVVKVKEPQPEECKKLRPGQILFTYLHLAPDPEQAKLLMQSGATAVAYETVVDQSGGLPLLAPMSEVAGRLSVQAGAHCLEKAQGGAGVLLGGVPGVAPARVLIIGGGVVGEHAASMAVGLGAEVTILDRSLPRLRQLTSQFGSSLKTLYSTPQVLQQAAFESDLVIGAVLIPGASAPKLLTKEQIGNMKPGSVLVDVAIDQGGCFETSRPTTHQEPTYKVGEVVHYCVANIPGAVPRTSAFALNNATLPYILSIANLGLAAALKRDKGLLQGLNVKDGMITCKAVAEALDLPYYPAEQALNEIAAA
ncbi:MAG: alanine dehydrogenase [Porticoccaceae bacterium]|nr:alanine dehydrogenase [Porticoccaceae bacterium]